MVPFDPEYSFNVEKTFVCLPLSAATPLRYLLMMFLYAVAIGWLVGCQ